jgi:hypothetical protein
MAEDLSQKINGGEMAQQIACNAFPGFRSVGVSRVTGTVSNQKSGALSHN